MAFTLAFVALWTAYSVLSRTNLDINSDMVENYAWSREWQLGYFKHPPFFAWVVAAWFKVFPTEDWAYYLLSFVNVAIGFAGIWALIGLFDRSPRRFAAIVAMSLTPFYTFSAIKFNANTILLSVWPWLAWATIAALRDARFAHAIAAGALAAIAMLSKYVSAVMLATLLVASFTIPGWQAVYRSRRFPAVVVAFFVVLAPHLVWLHQTGYTTFSYVDTNKADSLGRLVRSSFNFVAAQLLWLTPMLVI
ncbi:MAG: glycosyltransferase family 39 protein, partial [Hyphomicrobium sp.]